MWRRLKEKFRLLASGREKAPLMERHDFLVLRGWDTGLDPFLAHSLVKPTCAAVAVRCFAIGIGINGTGRSALLKLLT